MGESNGTSHVSCEMEMMWDRVTHPHIAPTIPIWECVCDWKCMPRCFPINCRFLRVAGYLSASYRWGVAYSSLITFIYRLDWAKDTYVRCSMRNGTRCDKWKLQHILHFLFCLLNRSRSKFFGSGAGMDEKGRKQCCSAQLRSNRLHYVRHLAFNTHLRIERTEPKMVKLWDIHLLSTRPRKYVQKNS